MGVSYNKLWKLLIDRNMSKNANLLRMLKLALTLWRKLGKK